MPRTGRPKTPLELTGEEREQLARWVRRAKSSQALALRCRIILACGEGLDNKTVAEQVGCSQNTVSKWRARFLEARLDGLTDDPRPGRPAAGEPWRPEVPMTPFERKYLASGHELWRCVVDLEARP